MRRRRYLSVLGTGLLGGCTDAPASEDGTLVPTSTGRVQTPVETPTPTQTETETETETATPDDPNQTLVGGVPVTLERYELRELSVEELPQSGRIARAEKVCDTSVEDLDDVPDLNVATIDGETGYMPLRTTRSILELLTCYRRSGDERFLEKAASKGRALVDNGHEHGGALYFPYTFDTGGSGADLEAPWYSSIAQGPALSGYLRLSEHTGDERFREAAEKTYRSFRIPRRETDGPWIAMVEDDYYWAEEYPADPPTHVLNGFCIGIWGLYEYWLHRLTEESRELVQAAITTVADHLEAYRAPGEVSWYALDHGYRGNVFYHSIHVHQLGELHELTGDPYFEEMRRKFVDDHEPEPI